MWMKGRPFRNNSNRLAVWIRNSPTKRYSCHIFELLKDMDVHALKNFLQVNGGDDEKEDNQSDGGSHGSQESSSGSSSSSSSSSSSGTSNHHGSDDQGHEDEEEEQDHTVQDQLQIDEPDLEDGELRPETPAAVQYGGGGDVTENVKAIVPATACKQSVCMLVGC